MTKYAYISLLKLFMSFFCLPLVYIKLKWVFCLWHCISFYHVNDTVLLFSLSTHLFSSTNYTTPRICVVWETWKRNKKTERKTRVIVWAHVAHKHECGFLFIIHISSGVSFCTQQHPKEITLNSYLRFLTCDECLSGFIKSFSRALQSKSDPL